MMRMKVEKEKCTGCKICQMVCSIKFCHGGTNIRQAALRVREINIYEEDFPVICQHCGGSQALTKASCSMVCPVGAFVLDEQTGVLSIDTAACVQCGACVEGCPFEVLEMAVAGTSPSKCNLCAERATGPICAEYCPAGALTWELPDVN